MRRPAVPSRYSRSTWTSSAFSSSMRSRSSSACSFGSSWTTSATSSLGMRSRARETSASSSEPISSRRIGSSSSARTAPACWGVRSLNTRTWSSSASSRITRETSAGCASARTSARRSSRPPSSRSWVAPGSRAGSSISAPERLEEARHDRLPQRLALGLADAGLPVAEADHRLRHRAVTPGAADLAERAAHHVARGADVAHVAHADVKLTVHGPGHDGPLRALDLQEELRELSDQLGVGDGTEVREDDPVRELPARDPERQDVEGLVGQLRALDTPERRVVRARVQVRERLEVRLGGAPLEVERVGLDAVEERRREALRDLHVRGAQVLGHDRRGRAPRGADVTEVRPRGRLLGAVVDDEVDLAERLLAEAR